MKNPLFASAFLIFIIKVNCKAQEQDISGYLSDGYVIFEKNYGDLNNDGLEDCVIITKGTDKKNITTRDYRGELDYNRRGILVLLNSENGYYLALKNYDCFSSENEYGGVYFSPDLWVNIEKGNLYIGYDHGRYGNWKYTFRKNESAFELIGYDSVSGINWTVYNKVSINFLSQKKILRKNSDIHANPGEEKFVETWENFRVNNIVKLSEVQDFDEKFFFEIQ